MTDPKTPPQDSDKNPPASDEESVFSISPEKLAHYQALAAAELSAPLLMAEFDLKALLVHRRVLNDLATSHSGRASTIISAHKAYLELVDFLLPEVEKWYERHKKAEEGPATAGRSSDLYGAAHKAKEATAVVAKETVVEGHGKPAKKKR